MLKTLEEGKKCRFGRQHVWMTALSAALNSNYDGEIPADPEWVWFCFACETVGPWEVERGTSTAEDA